MCYNIRMSDDIADMNSSVIALSKLYDLDDQRLAQISVKGDLIVNPTSSRIMTRSRTRQQPDQFTSVSATLKILKVLIEELQAAGAGGRSQEQEVIELLEEAQDDDDEWEDDPDTLDLASPSAKEGWTRLQARVIKRLEIANKDLALMRLVENDRKRDDETQAYLTEFFQNAARKPSFPHYFSQLTQEEQMKLRAFVRLDVA